MKKKVVIASVLKPINDARMYEKFAISLAEKGNCDVYLIGFSATPPSHPNITFHSLPFFNRISARRMMASWYVYKICRKVKPEVIIFNTHELQCVSVLYKILFGSKILYDVQENYFRNIWFQHNFFPVVKYPLAIYVRLKELVLSPFINHFLLAEEKYKEEIPFGKDKSTVILNKYKKSPSFSTIKKARKDGSIRFLFSGTINEAYGIREAIAFYKAVKEVKRCSLTIVGHVTNSQLLKELKKEASLDPRMKVHITPTPLDHAIIESFYPYIDYALTPYPLNQSTVNCIPVKFYEYVAYNIPFIIPSYNELWCDFIGKHNAGISIDYLSIDPLIVLAKLDTTPFFTGETSSSLFWESEEILLLNAIA